MAEDSTTKTTADSEAEQTDKGPSFIAIEAVGRLSYGRDLRLKAGDVFVAVDGNPITWDIDRFDQTLASYKELPALFTIFRKGEFFEVFVDQPIGCGYRYASDEDVAQILEKQPEHDIGPKDTYFPFEALRDMRRRVRLYRTDYSPYATVAPLFWLLYHRMWAPLGVVLATYVVSGFINLALFGLVYVLLCVYFHKAQTELMRGYSLYLEHYFWFILAERSTREAQETLRRFDEKCRFAFSHVPEPKIDEAEEARLAALIKEAQADLNAEAEGSDPKKDASEPEAA